MSKFYTYTELKEQFPDKWLIIDATFGTEGELVGGYIIEQCTNENIDDTVIKYDLMGKNYEHIRTSTKFNNGVQIL